MNVQLVAMAPPVCLYSEPTILAKTNARRNTIGGETYSAGVSVRQLLLSAGSALLCIIVDINCTDSILKVSNDADVLLLAFHMDQLLVQCFLIYTI